jgi:hypothetical protein
MSYIPQPTIALPAGSALALEPGMTEIIDATPEWLLELIPLIPVDPEQPPFRLHPTHRDFVPTAEQRNRFTTLLNSVGSFTFLTSNWTTEFYIYNHSPNRLVIIYRSGMGMAYNPERHPTTGWYTVDRERIARLVR